MATYETNDLEAIIQGNPSIDKISFDITLDKDVWLDGNVCQVSLKETAISKIR